VILDGVTALDGVDGSLVCVTAFDGVDGSLVCVAAFDGVDGSLVHIFLGVFGVGLNKNLTYRNQRK